MNRRRRGQKAVLKAIIMNPPFKRAESIERNFLKREGLVNEYEVLPGKPLGEDLGGH